MWPPSSLRGQPRLATPPAPTMPPPRTAPSSCAAALRRTRAPATNAVLLDLVCAPIPPPHADDAAPTRCPASLSCTPPMCRSRRRPPCADASAVILLLHLLALLRLLMLLLVPLCSASSLPRAASCSTSQSAVFSATSLASCSASCSASCIARISYLTCCNSHAAPAGTLRPARAIASDTRLPSSVTSTRRMGGADRDALRHEDCATEVDDVESRLRARAERRPAARGGR